MLLAICETFLQFFHFFPHENDDDDEKSHVFHVFRRSVLLILRHTVEIILLLSSYDENKYFLFKRAAKCLLRLELEKKLF